MAQPYLYLPNPSVAETIRQRFAHRETKADASYATVRDYCESVDFLPQISGMDGDLKNVQRPWVVKAILGAIPSPARLLEIGGGEPVVSGFLSELGYDVTLIDPYDGFGNGPTDYERYVARFPQVKIVREYFRPDLAQFQPASFDGIFSVSVLEHIPLEPLRSCFEAVERFLVANGASIHCFDFILQGAASEYDRKTAQEILEHQARLAQRPVSENLPALIEQMNVDVETFYLSPQGHHHWRGGRPYEEFPFRKVVSLQTTARKAGAAVA
jgi:hypothetical protein